jgi:hypothetical protein
MSSFIDGEARGGSSDTEDQGASRGRRRPANSTSRRFVFTCYDVATPLVFTPEVVRYAVWQREVCPTTNRRHFQGYIVLRNPSRFTAVAALLPAGTHIEACSGSDDDNVRYCTKDDSRDTEPDSGPFYFGTREVVGRGKRSDLHDVKTLLDTGATEAEIADKYFGAWTRGYRAFERYKRLKETPRDWAMNVEVHVGVPGSGKSRQARDRFPGAYWKQRSAWWCGYERHECVVFDDFYGWLPYDLVLRICDRYPLNVESKGGQINFMAKNVIFTSNLPFNEWYDWEKVRGDQKAFLRRVSRWVCYGQRDGDTCVLYDGSDYDEFTTAYSMRLLVDNILVPMLD